MIKTFRGLIADGAQERIRLETLDGKKGYRIKQFSLMARDPTSLTQESIVQIFSIKQTAVSRFVDFTNQTLLGAGYIENNDTTTTFGGDIVVFDRVTFNQDIFLVHVEATGTAPINYYLELEQISLDDVEATAVILKNFRNTNTV